MVCCKPFVSLPEVSICNRDSLLRPWDRRACLYVCSHNIAPPAETVWVLLRRYDGSVSWASPLLRVEQVSTTAHCGTEHQTLFKQPFLNPCWALQNKLFFNQFDTAARSLAPPPTVSNTLCSHYQYRFPVNVKIYIAYIKQQASTFIIIIQYVL